MDETSPPSGEVIHSCAWRVAYARAWRMVKVLARRSRNVRSDLMGRLRGKAAKCIVSRAKPGRLRCRRISIDCVCTARCDRGISA